MMLNYFDLAKRITREHVASSKTFDEWKTEEPEERERVTCTGEYTSCPCDACDQARMDHWADQQMDEERDGYLEHRRTQ